MALTSVTGTVLFSTLIGDCCCVSPLRDPQPTVVFFGDNIPRKRVEQTYRIVDEASLLIAAGSSLQVTALMLLLW